MSPDPYRGLRCRCVARRLVDGTPRECQVPDPYYDRCGGRASSDGFCDHCRSQHVVPFVLPNGRECTGCCQTDRFVHAGLYPDQMDTPYLRRVDRGTGTAQKGRRP